MSSTSNRRRVLYLTSPRESTWFASERSQQLRTFRDAISSNATFDLFISSIDNLLIEIKHGSVVITDMYNNLDVRDYDIVHIRSANPLAHDYVVALSNYLNHHGRKVYESADVPSFSAGKVSQMVTFALAGLGVPDTIASYRADYLRERTEQLGYPFVLKDNGGIKGQANFLIHDYQELDDTLAQHQGMVFVAQRFIANEGDYRVLYVSRREPLVFKRTAKPGSHLNNTSQGGSGTRVAADQLPVSALQLARRAKELAGRDIAGVDLVNEKGTDNWYLFEINLYPALATGEFLDEKIAQYIEAINVLLEEEA